MKVKTCTTHTRTLGDRQVRVLASTQDVDRDGDTIDPRGWDLRRYRLNPVVPFAHDYRSLPVARCASIQATGYGLEAVIEFPPKGTYPFADQVHDMMVGGFLNAVSVGFKPVDGMPARNRKGGMDYSACELTEISICPIPSNPSALVLQRSADVQRWTKTLQNWAEQQPQQKEGTRMKENDNDIVIRLLDDSPEEVARNKRAEFMREADSYWAFVRDLQQQEEWDRHVRSRLDYAVKHGPGRGIL